MTPLPLNVLCLVWFALLAHVAGGIHLHMLLENLLGHVAGEVYLHMFLRRFASTHGWRNNYVLTKINAKLYISLR